MKAFISGAVTLSLLIAIIITNAFLICSKTDEILSEIDSLSSVASESDPAELCLLWEECRSWVALTVHRENVDDIDDTLSQLTLEIESENDIGFLRQKAKLRQIVERLRKTESFSLSRIF